MVQVRLVVDQQHLQFGALNKLRAVGIEVGTSGQPCPWTELTYEHDYARGVHHVYPQPRRRGPVVAGQASAEITTTTKVAATMPGPSATR